MEKKQEEQVRQMRELQDHNKHLQCENDRLRAQVEKRRDLGERYVHDSGQARNLTARDKGKEPIVPDDVDTPANDDLSLSSSPNLFSAKRSNARSRQRHFHCLAFSNADNGTFRQVRKEIGQGQD